MMSNLELMFLSLTEFTVTMVTKICNIERCLNMKDKNPWIAIGVYIRVIIIP